MAQTMRPVPSSVGLKINVFVFAAEFVTGSFSLTFQVVPGLSLALGIWFLQESPRRLMEKDRHDEAREALRSLHGNCNNDNYWYLWIPFHCLVRPRSLLPREGWSYQSHGFLRYRHGLDTSGQRRSELVLRYWLPFKRWVSAACNGCHELCLLILLYLHWNHQLGLSCGNLPCRNSCAWQLAFRAHELVPWSSHRAIFAFGSRSSWVPLFISLFRLHLCCPVLHISLPRVSPLFWKTHEVFLTKFPQTGLKAKLWSKWIHSSAINWSHTI